jgi:thymidine kinase
LAKLVFFYGSMGSGKSTLALQLNHNFTMANKKCYLFTMKDRSGISSITNRMGMSAPAVNLQEEDNIYDVVIKMIQEDDCPPDYIICDEVQFYSEEQIDQLGKVVDNLGITVYCFGLTVDFKSRLFDSARRLFEIADEKKEIEVKTLCWCGKKGIMHARTIDGRIIREGEQKVVGDINTDGIGYEVLCRKHYFEGITKKIAEKLSLEK